VSPLVQSIVAGLVVALVSGLGWISYRHPRAYDRIARGIGLVSLILLALGLVLIGATAYSLISTIATVFDPEACEAFICHYIPGLLTLRTWSRTLVVVVAASWLVIAVLYVPSRLRSWDSSDSPTEVDKSDNSD